ncbi:xylose isomerase domain-containing protein [Natronococcus amylolyticus DSM 10524]|uniref:Xylose isomerase domain-containing protein n=1 Tax=Natronococcus amylolyticus DSM 10524 TaxID=1227497 RepID=L9X532_9EURY|nr:sugar phosphate isomerase/epimerase [Natronococcus amylolyticus]ELY56815.1 xylose isomerase domain-containing protein [Natronococcus amylolyticus DSM 10524]
MSKTAINLYSVRDLEDSTTDVLERVAGAGYDGIQFAGEYSPLHDDPDEIVETLETCGLEVAPPHVGIETLEDDRDAVRGAYAPLEIEGVVVPWLDPEQFESEEAVDNTAERLDALADELAADGWTLSYHNHDHEYVELGEESAFERFLEASDIGIELDVGWALAAGDDPAQRLRELEGRVGTVHLKDMDVSGAEPTFAELGEGDVDVRACIDAATDAGAEWLVYEHDDPDDPAASLEHGAAFLDEL